MTLDASNVSAWKLLAARVLFTNLLSLARFVGDGTKPALYFL